MRVGILFGGPSREREISFAGGRTVFDNLDKALFEPVPIFITSLKQFVLLHWPWLYKGTIRDFFPPVHAVLPSPHSFQVYLESLHGLSDAEMDDLLHTIGTPIHAHELPQHIDVAFLALHGAFGEDGQIQGLLEGLEIPYTGSGILPSAIGMHKGIQKRLMKAAGWDTPAFFAIPRAEWRSGAVQQWHAKAKTDIGFPLVVRPANQGSSIGVAIVEHDDPMAFAAAVDRAFFRATVTADTWLAMDEEARRVFVRDTCDIRDGVGLPLQTDGQTFYHPEEVFSHFETELISSGKQLTLNAMDGESEVVVEAFISGKEFSCIVIRNEHEDGTLGGPVALPPTEIRKGGEVFDYRSKYLAGLSRKVTPIDLPEEQIEAIRTKCEALFDLFGFHVYARIDGFIQPDGTIFLNDPNTTSGMLPSSFFFHQAAEIGLNPSQFLTYIIRTSLAECAARSTVYHHFEALLGKLDLALKQARAHEKEKMRVAVVLGGYSSERHISVESGRNIYEKLSSSADYEPLPVFLAGSADDWHPVHIPINLLLKDNADDIRDKISHWKFHPVVERIKQQCRTITAKYALAGYRFDPEQWTLERLKQEAGFVFIALHGRPGEDGTLQRELERIGLPYNGSGPDSSALTINKFDTLQLLRHNGFTVAGQYLVDKADWLRNPEASLDSAEAAITYPLIAKPVDDGCSSAVKRIRSREELKAFLDTLFRETEPIGEGPARVLKLKRNEEFPLKEQALLETLIGPEGAARFLEITGGMLIKPGKEPEFEVFEPSEAMATDSVLSLEEKFLAGEGQNLTPARFAADPAENARISALVRKDLERVARIVGSEGYCRIDAFVRIYADGRVETVIIEVNSLPGMTPATVIFHQAALNGYKPYEFIDRIIRYGIDKAVRGPARPRM
jgi:UDP-N-acetylmuramate--alanine ligase